MAIQTRTYLKGKFELDDYPSEQDFIDLIDSFFHQTEDTISSFTPQNDAELRVFFSLFGG